MYWKRFLSWFGIGVEEVTPPDPRLNEMNSMLVFADRLSRLISSGNWKGRRVTWRTSTITSVHPNIYFLIHTVRSTTNAVMAKTKPPLETRLSRKYLDNLTTLSKDNYLVDDQGMSCQPEIIMRELLGAITDLVNNILELEKTDANYFDYYLRQCTNLFGELEIIIKEYL